MGFRYHPISQVISEGRYDDAAKTIVASIIKVARVKMAAGLSIEDACRTAQVFAAQDVDIDARTMRRWINRLRTTGRDVVELAIVELKREGQPAKKPSKKAAKRAA